jgi:hypothetical protein
MAILEIQSLIKQVTNWIIIPCVIVIIMFFHIPLGLSETEKLPKYVGSIACKDCHKKEYKNFVSYAKKSTSFQSIVRVKKELTPQEIKGCYYCHTTGFGKPGGFVSEAKTPHLKNAGCEVCHGPGEFHVKTSNPDDIHGRLTARDCESCHTSERVKAFRYKPLIRGGAH